MALVPMFWALKCAGCCQVLDNEKSKSKGQVIFTIIPLNPQYFSQYGLFHQLRRNNESNLFFVFQINHRSTQASGSSLLILWLSIPMAYHPLKLFQNPEGLLSLKKASAILIDQAERENCQALFLFQPHGAYFVEYRSWMVPCAGIHPVTELLLTQGMFSLWSCPYLIRSG